MLLGPFGFAWVHLGRPRGRWGSCEFTRVRLGVDGFIRVPVGYILCARCLRIHSGSRVSTGVRLFVVGFIRVRNGSLGRAYMSSGSFGFACVNSVARKSRRVHSRRLGSLSRT